MLTKESKVRLWCYFVGAEGPLFFGQKFVLDVAVGGIYQHCSIVAEQVDFIAVGELEHRLGRDKREIGQFCQNSRCHMVFIECLQRFFIAGLV